VVEKLKHKKSKSKLAIARHSKAINEGVANEGAKVPKAVNKNDVVLNVSIIRDKLDSALEEAVELYTNSANRLEIEVDVDKCKSSRSDLNNWAILKKAYDKPKNRQLIGAYVSAREALHDLSNRVEKAKTLGGSMTQVDILHLLDSFRLLGVASYCILDEHLQKDFAEVGGENLKKARKARHEPGNKMRNEANRLFESGNFKSKNQAKYALKGPLLDFASRDDVGFVFKGNNIEDTIYEWLIYPEGKPARKKVAK
jgi:hypothetical protein